jgi:hypothetical protein
MYWFRTNNLLDFLLYLLLSGMWAVGGVLLVRYAFKLHRMERIVTGVATGFVLFISVSNLLANILPLTAAFWVASVLILVAGLLVAWRSEKQALVNKGDLRSIPLIIILLGITVLFVLILRGQSIFDEYLHLPLVSIMAAGDIPPHFYLNPAFYFAYHYAIQVFAASLVRLSSFFPWSAWDLSRALAIAFTLVLGWIWVRKITGSRLAAWLGTILFTFAGGARWLLLLLPQGALNWVSQKVYLVGTGLATAPTLAEALHRTWVIEGGGPVPFPFAFHNGIFVPVFFNLGSTGALPFMTIFLLLLLLPHRNFSIGGLVIWSLLFSGLALSAEHLFAVVWVGMLLAIGISLIFRKRLHTQLSKKARIQWGLVLAVSALLALVQGGFITETARNILATLNGSAVVSYNARGFSLRIPPGLLSAHLGSLSIFNPGQLLSLLAELGPALLIVPLVFLGVNRDLKYGNLFAVGLAISVIISLVFPLFFQYEVDRSITRMPATGLWTALVLVFPLLWRAIPHLHPGANVVLGIGFLACIVGGVVIFRVQLYSINTPQYAYYIDGLDAAFSVDYWDKLPAGAQVLDRFPERAVTVFGRIARASSGIYDPLPEWQALIADPKPANIAAAGYDYIYMDRMWWDALTPAQQAYFSQPCVDIMDERTQDNGKNIRLLIDISACQASP